MRFPRWREILRYPLAVLVLRLGFQPGKRIRGKWDLIPEGTDILITHGPPYGIGDLTARGDKAGCQNLLEVVEKLKPDLHIFGHIHEGFGVSYNGKTTFINASSCDQLYQPVNPPVVYEYAE